MKSCADVDCLGRLIRETVGPLIKGSCCLLDVPNHKNIGDLLILNGELDLLQHIGARPTYLASADNWNPVRVAQHDTLLLHGGGNFGDLWEKHQVFRELVIERFSDRRVILFPQTVRFFDHRNLHRAQRVFGAHQDLHLCARDSASFAFLRQHFRDNNVLLLPDAAFCISDLRRNKPTTERYLLLQRTDQEATSTQWTIPGQKFDKFDWPTYSHATARDKIERRLIMGYHSSCFRVRSALALSRHHRHDGFSPYLTRKYIDSGISFISSYRAVVTTRLHGHILALLLSIPNVLVDNSYGKNRDFFDTWSRDLRGTAFASKPSEIASCLAAVGAPVVEA